MKKLPILLFIAVLSIAAFAAETTEEAPAAETEPQSVSQMAESIKTFIAENGINFIIKLATAAAIFFVGKWIAKTVATLLQKAMEKSHIDPTLSKFARNLTYSVLVIIVVIAALTALGVPTTSAVAILGAAGLAVGLALQGTLSNFAAGIMLIINKPFKVGDYVEAGGTAGTVREIEIFNTRINSVDNKKVIIPNAQITGANIVNYSSYNTRRIDLVIGVSYDDDLKKAREVIESVLRADSRILADPAYKVAVSELGDSSVNIVVRPWVNTPDYWPVRFDLIETIKVSLEENGLSIPYPQRDVHMFNTPATA